MDRVLIVDDESSMRAMLSIALGDEGWEVHAAGDGNEALALLSKQPVDVVVSDIRMPGVDGMELLRHVRDRSPRTEVSLITAHASTDSAIEAVRLGAYDYVTKPFDVEELKVTVRHALERQALQRENVMLRGELTERHGFGNLVGESSAMHRVFELIRRVKDSTSTVLIAGESGTGKELVARAIHYNGERDEAPFVAVNCAALPAQLLESELFGHVKGAFTGADRHKEGLFEAADGGTILLDEIGDMPLEMQPKLLRVLEDRMVRQVGSTHDTPVDVRVLAATNQDLRAAFVDGRFREDLYYRLNVIQIDLPPLRQRRDDILLLADHYFERLTSEIGREIDGMSREARQALRDYAWPGNVRELVNAVRHAITMEPTDRVQLSSLPRTVTGASPPEDAIPNGEAALIDRAATGEIPEEGIDLETHMDQIKRDYMRAALSQSGGVQTRAAKLLGMSFRSFRYYAKKFVLDDPSPE
ncbi:MAG TPA: sigma-54 dependent transcriptional regulator [Acidobacteriota bacterium]|nr:sigma-54 dependent transcriptional regulator [Acidobacteriota bacterium]